MIIPNTNVTNYIFFLNVLYYFTLRPKTVLQQKKNLFSKSDGNFNATSPTTDARSKRRKTYVAVYTSTQCPLPVQKKPYRSVCGVYPLLVALSGLPISTRLRSNSLALSFQCDSSERTNIEPDSYYVYIISYSDIAIFIFLLHFCRFALLLFFFSRLPIVFLFVRYDRFVAEVDLALAAAREVGRGAGVSDRERPRRCIPAHDFPYGESSSSSSSSSPGPAPIDTAERK